MTNFVVMYEWWARTWDRYTDKIAYQVQAETSLRACELNARTTSDCY